MIGEGDLWVTEYTITYQGKPAFTVSIMEFRDGKVVHETQYFADPFEAPAWRKQWVEQSVGAGVNQKLKTGPSWRTKPPRLMNCSLESQLTMGGSPMPGSSTLAVR